MHTIGAVTLECESEICDVRYVSKEKTKISALEDVEILDDHDEDGDHIGIQMSDYEVNLEYDHAEEESYRVNLGGFRRDDEPIPDSYWDNDLDDEDDVLTEDDDE